MTVTSSPRTPSRPRRFERGESLRRVRLTARDLRMLDFVAAHRFATSEHLVALFAGTDTCSKCRGTGDAGGVKCRGCACATCQGNLSHVANGSRPAQCSGSRGSGVTPSPATIVERLGQLFYAGLLDRPIQQGDQFAVRIVHDASGATIIERGNFPTVVAISDDGARALLDWHADVAGVPVPDTDDVRAAFAADGGHLDLITARGRLEWLAKNREASRVFLRHTLQTTDLSVALMLAARKRPHLKLIQRNALHGAIPADIKPTVRTFQMTAMIRPRPGDERVAKTVVPDWPCALQLPDGSLRNYLIEIDTGSETLSPSNPGRDGGAFVLEKLLAYQAAHMAGLHRDQFGWSSFAVCIVTSSAARRDNIIALIRRHDALLQSRIFMVTDRAALFAAPDILAHEWATRSGKPATLVPGHALAARPLALAS